MKRGLALAAAAAVALTAPATAPAAGNRVKQLVAFRDGSVRQGPVRAAATSARASGRRCGVAQNTALSALLRSSQGETVALKDFGACSSRGRDGGGLFVTAIGGDRNRGTDGWVYKVGKRAATAGAADPSGPFGRGRLRAGQRVTWFFCRMRSGSCQRTLTLRYERESGGVVGVVTGHDDQGRSVPVAAASVIGGRFQGVTDAKGRTPVIPATGQLMVARKKGLVSSFSERAPVR